MLESIAADPSNDCATNEACDGLDCSISALGLQFSAALTILPCNDPPAVRIVLTNPSNDAVLVDETVDHSQEISGPFGVVIDVTLDQLPGAIGLQVCIICVTCMLYGTACCIIIGLMRHDIVLSHPYTMYYPSSD